MRNPLFSLLLLASLLGNCSYLWSQNEANYDLLWRIEGNGMTQPSYIFGTIDTKDSRAFEWSDSTLLALNRCSSFAVISHPDSILNELLLPQKKSFLDVLSKEEQQRMEEKITTKNGYSADYANIPTIWQLQQLLQPTKQPQNEKPAYLNMHLYGIARSLDKPITGLVTIAEQQQFFLNLPLPEQQKAIRKLAIVDSIKYNAALEKLLIAYQSGDSKKIAENLLQQLLTDNDAQQYKLLLFQKLQKQLQTTTTFAAIDLAYLTSENGLLQLLRTAGYEVRPVVATFEGIATKYSLDSDKLTWYKYADSAAGYALEAPTLFQQTRILNNQRKSVATDHISGASYQVVVKNVAFVNEKNTNLMESFITSTLESLKGDDPIAKVITRRNFDKKGLKRTEVLLQKTANEFLRVQFMYNDGLLYYALMGNSRPQVESTIADHFFDSFRLIRRSKTTNIPPPPPPPPLERKPSSYSGYHQFEIPNMFASVRMPVYKEESYQGARSEELPEEEAYNTVVTYSSQDKKTGIFYFVSYSDLPTQLYLADKQQAYDAMEENLRRKNHKIISIDTVFTDGVEGRDVKVWFDRKYYTQYRLYIRNNRRFLFMTQHTNDPNKARNYEFFSSIKFTPFPEVTLEQLQPKVSEDSLFSMLMMDSFSYFYHPEYDDNIVYSSENVASSTRYFLSGYDLGIYYGIHEDSLVSITTNHVLEENEKVLNQTSYQLWEDSDRKVVDLIVHDTFQNSYSRAILWFDGSHFYHFSIVGDRKEVYDTRIAQTMVRSYKRMQPHSELSVFSPKGKIILQDLRSSDEDVAEAALEGFKEYVFLPKELPILYENLELGYADDTLTYGYTNSERLLAQFEYVSDSTTVPFLEQLFDKKDSNIDLQIVILNTIVEIDSVNGLSTYKEALLNMDFTAENNTSYLLYPLRENIDFLKENIAVFHQKLFNETTSSDYLRALQIATDEDSTFAEVLLPYREEFWAWAKTQQVLLADCIKKDKTCYNADLYYLMHLFHAMEQLDYLDVLSTGLIQQKGGAKSLAYNAIKIRFLAELPIPKKDFKRLLKDYYYRFDFLQLAIEYQQENLVPKSYWKPLNYATAMTYRYLEDEDAEDITYKGQYYDYSTNTVYFVYSHRYQEYTYLALVNPYISSSNQVLSGDVYESCIVDWNTIENPKEWESTAATMLKNRKEEEQEWLKTQELEAD